MPDSPSTRAMMKRLLAKPAPISSSHFSATSGSESEAVSSRSHTHTRRRDASFSPPRRGAMGDGEEKFHEDEKIFVGEDAAGVEFDMNLDVLDQNIVSMGQWVGTQSDRYFERVLSPAPSSGELKEKEREREKEKEREKRPRNVLRRRPSANKSASGAQSPQSQPSSPPSTSASEAHLPIIPPQGPFPPLTLSPFFLTSHEQKAVQPQSSASKAHADPHHHQRQINSSSTPLRRMTSASAAMPHSTTRSSGNKTTQLESPNATASQPLSPGKTMIRSSSLHPPLRYASSRSTAGSSRGSSPARSPIVSTLGPGTPSPTKTTEALRRSPTPHMAPPSAPAREWGKEPERADDKEKGRLPAITPAASLIEAYKRQEREREEQRIAMERLKERQFQLLKEEKGLKDSKEGGKSTPTTGTNTPTPTNKVVLAGGEARSKSTPSSRRNSLSTHAMAIVGDTINFGDQKRSSSSAEKEIDGVVEKRKSGNGNGSGSVGSLGAGSHVPGRSEEVHSENVAAGGDRRRGATVSAASSTEAKNPKAISSRPPVVHRGLEDISVKPAPRSPHPHVPGEGQEVVTPYYTVFGSTSGRVVAVGSPDDSKWNTYNQGYWDSTIVGPRTAISTGSTETDKGKAKESLGRSLSRKVSGRWKKQGGVVVGSLDREDDFTRAGRLLSRSSMQERRKGGSTTRRDESGEEKRMRMRNRRSLRLSIDKFSDVVGKDFDERLVLRPILSKNDAGSPGVKSDGDTDHGTGLSKVKKADSGSPAGSGGNRFWKLMKRMSVGGLREKCHDTELPPPVPALPKDLQNLHPSRSNDSSHVYQPSEKPEKSASASSSPSSTTISPKSRTLPSSPPGPNQPRPSTTTRSSSPVSSDVASSKFFRRNHSAHSSTSSFDEGNNPPPLPKPPQFAQHIIDPSELGKAEEEGARSPARTQPPRYIPIPNQRMDDEDWSIVRSPSVELPSLPLPPPRRPVVNLNSLGGKAPELDRPESPTIPSFSTNDAVNAFPSRRLSATLSARSRNSPNSPYPSPSTITAQSSSFPTSLPPPPRPLRSVQRPVPGSVAQRPPVLVIDDVPAGRKSESHFRIQHNRLSSGGLSSASTARPMHRRSSSIGGISSRHQSISPPGSAIDTMFTFRELDDSAGPRKYALTEEEKAEKWDDLMERSARAGGTLHLAAGAGVLPSDRLE